MTMIQVNNLTKKAETFADNLDELGVDVIDVETAIAQQAIRVIAEADSDDALDKTVRHVISAYQYAVHTFGDETIGRVDMEIRQSDGAAVVQFTVRREWLPADRDDVDGWNQMVDRVSATHEVIYE